MTDLAKLKAAVENDEFIHVDDLKEEHGVDIYKAKWVKEIPEPPTCVFCNAPWTPEMIELVEESGYCETCSGTEQVIDVFCSACTRLVYRKEI